MTNPDTSLQSGPVISPELDSPSRRLVAARSSAVALAAFPGDLPSSLDDAYLLQSASIARWPDTVRGWKVGLVPPEYRKRFGADRLCGPIFATSILSAASGAALSMPIFVGGFAAVEAEFVFRLGQAVIPGEFDDSDDGLAALVSGLHVGVEIASSPMADVNRLGPVCVICDFGNNAGLIVGPAIKDWRAQPAEALTVSVSVDGQTVGAASAAAIEGGLLQALRFLLHVAGRRGIKLDAGTYVSCGAVTGIHEVTTESSAAVDFGEDAVFDLRFEALKPWRSDRWSAAR